MYTWNEIQDCPGKSNIQQEEDPIHQQIGVKIEEHTRENAAFGP